MANCVNVSTILVLLLAMVVAQAYICNALINQQSAWVTNHLHKRKSLEMNTDRRLREQAMDSTEKSVSNGWRGNLIHPTYETQTEDLTMLQKIRHDVERSKERARYLYERSRGFTTGSSARMNGRMLDEFISKLQFTSGAYSMEISIGTPPQSFRAIADAGSDLVWLQCAECSEVQCFESTGKFFPNRSTSYGAVGCGTACNILGRHELTCGPTCQYSYAYDDTSQTQGTYSLETITIEDVAGANVSIKHFQFGCGLDNKGTFRDTSGIVGLGRGPISFTSQIAKYLNGSNKFSYCLLNRYDQNINRDRSPIFFGDAEVPTIGERLQIPSTIFELDPTNGTGGVVFDSGTTYTVLRSEAYQAVTGTFSDAVDKAGLLRRVN
ncbi:hypothetical protein R1flu_002897 [Riccia fluitans]|uniref:Peptidase A1 domain-containing protein n=1 Tax=Riccia fluitans TaxID=41844 RepID=A0ABD1Y7F1_9MARC